MNSTLEIQNPFSNLFFTIIGALDHYLLVLLIVSALIITIVLSALYGILVWTHGSNANNKVIEQHSKVLCFFTTAQIINNILTS